jgi:hypothetical protein
MRIFKDLLAPLAVIMLAGVLLYEHLSPRVVPAPDHAVNAVALGRTYAPVLISSYADAWLEAAKTLDEGKSIAEAQKTLQDTWKDARIKAFKAEVEPGFALVLPAGTEPSDATKRTQVAELWRSFARGLKGGR